MAHNHRGTAGRRRQGANELYGAVEIAPSHLLQSSGSAQLLLSSPLAHNVSQFNEASIAQLPQRQLLDCVLHVEQHAEENLLPACFDHKRFY